MNDFDAAVLDELDDLAPADALDVLARLRAWTLVAVEEQMARAKAHGMSWRAIAAASGTNPSTVRRWAVWGAPEHPRRRV